MSWEPDDTGWLDPPGGSAPAAEPLDPLDAAALARLGGPLPGPTGPRAVQGACGPDGEFPEPPPFSADGVDDPSGEYGAPEISGEFAVAEVAGEGPEDGLEVALKVPTPDGAAVVAVDPDAAPAEVAAVVQEVIARQDGAETGGGRVFESGSDVAATAGSEAESEAESGPEVAAEAAAGSESEVAVGAEAGVEAETELEPEKEAAVGAESGSEREGEGGSVGSTPPSADGESGEAALFIPSLTRPAAPAPTAPEPLAEAPAADVTLAEDLEPDEIEEVEEVHEVDEADADGAGEVAPAAAPARPPAPPPDRRRRKHWAEGVFAEHFQALERVEAEVSARRDADFISELLGLDDGARVLDVGAGTGHLARALAEKGLSVVGLDNSLSQVLRANETLAAATVPEGDDGEPRVAFMHGDMREIPTDETFDAVACVGTTFGYFEEDQNRQVLDQIYARLRPGGRLVLQVFNRDHLVSRLPVRSWWQGKGCLVLDEAEMNFFANRLRVHRTVVFEDGRQYEHYMFIRAYTLHDVGKLMTGAGLRVIEVSGSRETRGRFYGATSPDIWVLAERPETDASE